MFRIIGFLKVRYPKNGKIRRLVLCIPAAGTDAAVVSQCLVRVAAVVAAASVAGSSVLQPGSSLPL